MLEWLVENRISIILFLSLVIWVLWYELFIVEGD